MTVCASDLVAMKWALLISGDTGLFCFCWLGDMSALDTGASMKNNNNNNIAVFFSFFFWHECKLKSAILTAPAKSVSGLYNRLPRANDENTLYIKGKWGREAWIEPSEEAWAVTGASSGPLPMACWKHIIRYFNHHRLEKYKDMSSSYWRQCVSMVTNHFPIFLWNGPD